MRSLARFKVPAQGQGCELKMHFLTFAFPFVLVLGSAAVPAALEASKGVVIKNDHPLIHFHGRWDASPGTWW